MIAASAPSGDAARQPPSMKTVAGSSRLRRAHPPQGRDVEADDLQRDVNRLCALIDDEETA